MSVNAVCSPIDLGAVELNDLVSSAGYRQMVEMQNFVFRDSRSQIYSFAYSAGWSVIAGSPFAVCEADIPEGIDQILITSRGATCILEFYDFTDSVLIATLSHGGTPDTLTATYAIPAPGIRQFAILVNDSGSIFAEIIEWDAQAIP